MRLRRSALAALVLLVLSPAVARAADPADVVDDLRQDAVYIDRDARTDLDPVALRAALGADRQLFVAVVPAEQGGSQAQARELVSGLGDRAAVVLVAGPVVSGAAGAHSGLGRGETQRAIDAHAAEPDATAALAATLRDIVAARADGAPPGAEGDASGGPARVIVLLLVGFVVLVLFGACIVLALLVQKRRRRAAADRREHAELRGLHDRLAAEIDRLEAVDSTDPLVSRAVGDAAYRHLLAAELMDEADVPGHWLVAHRTVVEGLAASAYASGRLGEDAPAPPVDDRRGPQLAEGGTVRLGEETYDGTPDYDPDHPHRYPGGSVAGRPVPGGWYTVPFW
ncbi:MAG: hypothetical protein JWL64_1246, partial [Frankiales bacterium]|nr:hypothetical protein [Frankiales bacterium]